MGRTWAARRPSRRELDGGWALGEGSCLYLRADAPSGAVNLRRSEACMASAVSER